VFVGEHAQLSRPLFQLSPSPRAPWPAHRCLDLFSTDGAAKIDVPEVACDSYGGTGAASPAETFRSSLGERADSSFIASVFEEVRHWLS